MLLDLPVELIQLVFYYADTPSYLQTAYASRTLVEVAAGCREVVLHHLEQTPGVNVGFDALETKDLFLLLRKRASKLLYGAEFRASRTLHIAEGRTIDPRSSSIAASGTLNVALAFKGEGIVHTYAANNGLLFPRRPLRPPYDQPGTIEVLKTVFGGSGSVSLLHRFTPELAKDEDELQHPFVRQAMQSTPEREIYLALYENDSTNDHVTVYVLPDRAEYEPLALAVADKYKFAISWQHNQDRNLHEVVLYAGIPDPQEEGSSVTCLRYMSSVIVDEDGRVPDGEDDAGHAMYAGGHMKEWTPVSNMTFNDQDGQLLYYHGGDTLYDVYQSLEAGNPPTASRLHRNSCRVPFREGLMLTFSIGIPFFATHQTYDLGADRSVCHWKYLSFGLGKHRQRPWTAACIVMSEARCRASNCGHVVNLDRGRRLNEWKVVARLRSYPEESINSVGCIVAASPRGTRLAVANWNTVYIWALEPEELIEGNKNGFYPSSWRLTDSGIVDLEPIVLQLDAVCFKLCFTTREDELLVVTDRGLMYWDIGPHGTGARMTRSLDLDGRGGTWIQSDRL